MIKIDKRSRNIILIWFILLMSYGCLDNKNVDINSATYRLGTKVVIDGDTLTVIEYFEMGYKYKLSNGLEVDGAVVCKQKPIK